MKKILIGLFIIIYGFSYFSFFNDKNMTEYDKVYNIERNLDNSYEILLPSTVNSMDKQLLYNKLTEVVDKYKGNIILIRSFDKKIIKYVYLNEESYFNNYSINNGRQLNIDDFKNEKEYFLSTANTGNNNQIGKLNEFAGDHNFEIRTLWDMCKDNTLTLSGYVTVQLPNDNIQEFINELEAEINIKEGIELFEKSDVNFTNNDKNAKYILYSLYFILLLLVVYDSLRNYKKVGIEKLLGYSNKDIWLFTIRNIFITQVISISIVTICMSMYLFKEINTYMFTFLYNLIIHYAKQLILILFLSSLPYGYILSIKVSDMIKNKKNTKEIIVVNTIIKCVLTSIIIVMSLNIITNFIRIKNVYNSSFEKWEEVRKYECISGCNIEGNIYFSDEMDEKLKSLYMDSNKRGAILAEFNNYTEAFRQFNSVEVGEEYKINFAIVNVNYLLMNEIKDEYGNRINISENEKKNILLLPEIYKNKEKEVIDHYLMILSSNKDGKKINIDDMKIIWIKDNQELFSYNIEVNPKENNMVNNSIYMIMTEANLMGKAYQYVMNFTGAPFKILKDDSYDLKNFLNEVIGGNYEYTITSADEQIASEVDSVKEIVKYNSLGILLVLIGVLLIITQNIYNYVEQYKRDIFIKNIHGYSFFMKYKLSILINIICGILSSILAITIVKDNFLSIMMISLFMLIIEMIFWITILKIMEKRKIINVIKGC